METELNKERDASAVMDHHRESLEECDMETVMSDYDENLIAIVNMDGNTRLLYGEADLKKLLETELKVIAESADLAAEAKDLILRGTGRFVVSAHEAGAAIPLGAYTYIVKNGKAVYVTGYSKNMTRIQGSIKPADKDAVVNKESMEVVEACKAAIESENWNEVRTYLAEDVVLISNLAKENLTGVNEIAAFYQENCGNYQLKPESGEYTIYQAVEELVMQVYENPNHITAETWLVENGKIALISLVTREY